MTPRVGSLFSGYAGLDMAVASYLGGTTIWHSEIDPGACKILAHHWPEVPNLGDITRIDWASVEPVDVITGGSPCQDVSAAGKRAGMRPGTRSGLWESMREGIAALRPGLVVWENVRGVTSACAHSDLGDCPRCVGGPGQHQPVLRALGRVLGDLADLGYDARWFGLRAADVGAPHGRFRIFVTATDSERGGFSGWAPDTRRWTIRRTTASGTSALTAADARSEHGQQRRVAASGQTSGGWAFGELAGRDRASLADSDDDATRPRREPGHEGNGWPESAQRRPSLTDADCHALRQQPIAEPGRSGQTIARLASEVAADTDRDGLPFVGREQLEQRDPDRCGSQNVAWGAYEPAIRRWESILGRPAPAPTELGAKGGQRLSPAFVEWMMGLPAGHVTAVPGVSRNEQLKALGNGVVPQQAFAALSVLLGQSAERAA